MDRIIALLSHVHAVRPIKMSKALISVCTFNHVMMNTHTRKEEIASFTSHLRRMTEFGKNCGKRAELCNKFQTISENSKLFDLFLVRGKAPLHCHVIFFCMCEINITINVIFLITKGCH